MNTLTEVLGTLIAIVVIVAVTVIIVVGQLVAYGPLRTDCPREEMLGEIQGRVVCIPLLALEELELGAEDVGLR
jgi:hypothetical protein